MILFLCETHIAKGISRHSTQKSSRTIGAKPRHVDRYAVDPELPVEVGSGRQTGVSEQSDLIANANLLADPQRRCAPDASSRSLHPSRGR